jgi:acetolactate synthase I/II/III large subunit
MKFTDYIIDFFAKKSISHVFGVTGGAVCHLFDSVNHHPEVEAVFNHHEQASAFAATAYARITKNCGVAMVTTGPGGTNAITGLTAAWMDSIPVIFISGQTRLEHTALNNKAVRSLAMQELDIISIVDPITKYAVIIRNVEDLRYEMEKAYYMAFEGRPGPVWIDVPLDFQWQDVDIENSRSFEKENIRIAPQSEDLNACLELLKKSQRPLALVGFGVYLSHAEKEVKDFLETWQIPFVTSWTASDMFETAHELNTGRIGVSGQRGGNLAIQNADFVLAIGSHLNMPMTGTNLAMFAREATIAVVNIDPEQFEHSNVEIDLPIHADAKIFLQKMQERFEEDLCIDEWRNLCFEYRGYNFPYKAKVEAEAYLDPYVFMGELSKQLDDHSVVIVDGGGTCVYTSFQGISLKKNQRLSMSSTLCSMGSGLPESIGAAFANLEGQTICLTGDGSLQFNIQELQTLVHHNLNVKIFVFNNNGYLSIRHTQKGYMGGRYVGSDPQDVSLPEFKKVAHAFGLKTMTIDSLDNLVDGINNTLNLGGPVLCEVIINPEQQLYPVIGVDMQKNGPSVARPLEDMAPFLDRDKFDELMKIPKWEGQ